MIEKHKDKKYEEVMKEIFDYMLLTFIYETPTNLRRRTERIKSMLQEYKKTYSSIVVVTHYNIVRFTIAA